MRLLLARHAESTVNAEKRFQGPTINAPLSENGRKQAAELAGRLRAEKIRTIYCSTLLRAIETAEAINKWHKLPIHQRNELEEQDFGVLNGQPRNKLPPEMREMYMRSRVDPAYRIPGGESFKDVMDRLGPFLMELDRQEGTVLVVAHGRVLKAFLYALVRKPYGELMDRAIPNCALIELEMSPQGAKLTSAELGPDNFS